MTQVLYHAYLHDASTIVMMDLVLGRTYEGQNCSAARALEVVGERWSLLIMRDALFRGMTRFSDFQRSLGLASNVLAKRLDGFVENGLMEQRVDPWRAEQQEYVPTDKGRDLKPVVLALTAWGDRWAARNGPPVTFEHESCGGKVEAHLLCLKCGRSPDLAHVVAKPTRSRRRRR